MNAINAPVQFNFHSNAIRVVTDENGEPWFCAKDVCDVLGYKNDSKAIADHCRNAGVTKRYLGVTTGKTKDGGDAAQQVAVTFINEGNLYRLIIKSRKPEAEPFESWVCDDVLPSIRKTGKYEKPPYGLKSLEAPRAKKHIKGGLELHQQDAINDFIKQRLQSVPQHKRGSMATRIYSAITNKFGTKGMKDGYKNIAPEHFDNIIQLIARLPLDEENLGLLHITPLELDALVKQRVDKALEGEVLPKPDVTLSFSRLTDNRHRRWLVTQAKDEMVMFWPPTDDQEIMSWQDFRKKIAYEPTELQALIEQLPIDLLPGVLNLSARRLAASIKG